VEEILHQAEQLEKEYDWLGAAESYEKALNLLPQDDFLKRGENHERLGYAFYRFRLIARTSLETGCVNLLLLMKRLLDAMEN
jgi:hypothetical protein